MQNESFCAPDLKNPISSLLKNDITSKIEEFAYSEGLFDQSCADFSSELAGTFSTELNPKDSFLIKCLNSKEVNSAISKNVRLAAVANTALAGYIAKVAEIENGQSKLQIKCQNIAKSEYEPKSQTITLATNKEGLAIDTCKSMAQVITHEVLHSVGLNEDDTKLIDSTCGYALKVEGIKNPSCKAVYPKQETRCGLPCLNATKKALEAKNSKIQKEIEKTVKEEIKTADFVPVQDADIQEITNPTSTASYEKSVDRVYTAMSTNMEKIASPLNRAIATTVSTAEASTTASNDSGSKFKRYQSPTEKIKTSASLIKERSPASNSKNTNEEYTVEEILADKYDVPVQTIKAMAANPSATTADIASASQPTATTQAIQAKAATSNTRSEVARGGAASGASGAGAALSNSSAGGGVPGRSTSSGTSSRNPAAVQDSSVQELSSFSEIRGSRYKELQERYNDPAFRKALQEQNLAIEYRRENMTTRIGDTSNSRKALFRDDGKALKKVTGAQ